MSRKSKVSFEGKLRAVTWYLEGKASCSQLARQFGVNPCTRLGYSLSISRARGAKVSKA